MREMAANGAIWLVEATEDEEKTKELIRAAVRETRKKSDDATSLWLVTIISSIPAFGIGDSSRISKMAKAVVERHTMVVKVERLQPIAVWCKKEMGAELNLHVEKNDKRAAGLCEAAKKFGASKLFMNSKKSTLLRKGTSKIVDYCSLHLPPFCGLVVFQNGKKIRDLPSSMEAETDTWNSLSEKLPENKPGMEHLKMKEFSVNLRISHPDLIENVTSKSGTHSSPREIPGIFSGSSDNWKTLVRTASPNQQEKKVLQVPGSAKQISSPTSTSSSVKFKNFSGNLFINSDLKDSPPWKTVSKKSLYRDDSITINAIEPDGIELKEETFISPFFLDTQKGENSLFAPHFFNDPSAEANTPNGIFPKTEYVNPMETIQKNGESGNSVHHSNQEFNENNHLNQYNEILPFQETPRSQNEFSPPLDEKLVVENGVRDVLVQFLGQIQESQRQKNQSQNQNQNQSQSQSQRQYSQPLGDQRWKSGNRGMRNDSENGVYKITDNQGSEKGMVSVHPYEKVSPGSKMSRELNRNQYSGAVNNNKRNGSSSSASPSLSPSPSPFGMLKHSGNFGERESGFYSRDRSGGGGSRSGSGGTRGGRGEGEEGSGNEFEGIMAELVRVTEVVAAAQRVAEEAKREAEMAREDSKREREEREREERRRKEAEEERERERAERRKAEEERRKAEGEKDWAVKQFHIESLRALSLQAEAESAKKSALESAQKEYSAKQNPSRPDFRLYTESEISAACDGFPTERIIGEGAHGTVYSGVLAHTPVAVKRIKNENLGRALKEFEKEVEVHAGIRHPHLVLLMGHCREPPSLAYELMPRGSLHDRLACRDGTDPLPWNVRFDSFESVCRALLYLHARSPPIVHLDVKPANILLDKNFVAKVGDVGLAQFLINMDPAKSYIQHTMAVGTAGYVDPMYGRLGQFSTASDVFSLGRVLWDLLIGFLPGSDYVDADSVEELEIATELNDVEKIKTLLDPTAGSWPTEVAVELCRLAMQCCQLRRRDRPDLANDVMPRVSKLRPIVDSSLKQAEEEAGKEAAAESIKSFICPITQEIMESPVIAADGFTYELLAIEQWLLEHNMSPITNELLASTNLVPNHILASLIRKWSGKTAFKQ